ncbi:YveK family protein [Paenibacillus larvae]|nr:Wzz/FepE/Etk N-terminal domain-containing protein [Paenibacillus larvae]AVG12364.1 lipopolysaccharide biosynthesis protein [Paenibacillus larvae subsp. larvae DSM 25430]MDR5569606.1 Wzz/FepE/Etk N-terminal domain-containing protein [Paenibacillus larvae]MDR5596108.1 Wzz/FepE/Etk N-terminal domain-containing protein [Paenibacillus larvae]
MDIEISQIVRAVKKRVWWIVLGVIVAVGTAAFFSFVWMTPRYEAKTTLLVRSQQTENQVSMADLTTAQRLVSTYGEIIKSRKVAEKVIEQGKLPWSSDELIGRIRFQASRDSLVTAVYVEDQEARRASETANLVAETFITYIHEVFKVDHVSILDKADPNGPLTPIRPKPFLNMLLAFLASIVLGILVAVLSEVLDRTFKTEQEVERFLGIPVLATVPRVKFKTGRKKTDIKKKRREARSESTEAGQTSVLP